jgi:hypothetical protein
MSRIATPASIEAAPAAARPALEAVKAPLGTAPNLFRVIANSPAALQGYLLHVALNALTNYVKEVANTEIDFPVVAVTRAA